MQPGAGEPAVYAWAPGLSRNAASQQRVTSTTGKNSALADLALALRGDLLAVGLAFLRFGRVAAQAPAHPQAGGVIVLARRHLLASQVPLVREVSADPDARYEEQRAQDGQTPLPHPSALIPHP